MAKCIDVFDPGKVRSPLFPELWDRNTLIFIFPRKILADSQVFLPKEKFIGHSFIRFQSYFIFHDIK